MKKSRVHNSKYLEKYFTQFPNMIDDHGLDPYEFRMLIHYYRVGECWEGARRTAEVCKMSIGKVSECRQTLQEKGFIMIEEKNEGVIIHLVDLSSENLAKYRSCGEHLGVDPVHSVNDVFMEGPKNSSPGEHKKNPSKKNPLRIQTASQVALCFLEVRRIYETKANHVKMTTGRERVILARQKDFNSHWPGRDFLKACKFMFEYKAKEWWGTDIWKNFKIETLFRDSHFVDYLETAESNKGIPPAPKTKNQPPPTTAPPSAIANPDRFKKYERDVPA